MDVLHSDPPLWVNGGQAGISLGTVERTVARYTVLIGDVVGLYRKLEYERGQFLKAHNADPPDVDRIIYTCLNFIVTAQSLYDWLRKEVEARDGGAFDADKLKADAAKRLHYQAMCHEVANTFKHHSFKDGIWPGGSVKLDYLPGDGSGFRPLAVLIFQQPGGMSMEFSGLVNIITMEWRHLLIDYGLLPDPNKPAADTSSP